MKHKKFLKMIIVFACMAVVLTAALFALWWFGAFIPDWAEFENMETGFATGYVTLANGKLKVYDGYVEALGENKDAGAEGNQKSHDKLVGELGKPIWQSEADWRVQSYIVQDIDGDNDEEILMLVWKHGSYGDHLPEWVEHNDIKLEQHIFIYKWDSNREDRLKPIWMSSSVGKETLTLSRGAKGSIVINTRGGSSNLWHWKDFGLKILGENKETSANVICAGDNLMHHPLLEYGQSSMVDTNNTEVTKYNMYDYLYADIAEYISEADIAIINQETPLVDRPELQSDYPRFGTDYRVAYALVRAGFDVFNISNNHMLDQGMYGIDTTISKLTEAGELLKEQDEGATGNVTNQSVSPGADNQNGITVVGAKGRGMNTSDYRGNVALVESNGITIAVLGYTYGTNGHDIPDDYPYAIEVLSDKTRIEAQIKYARARADVVVVYAHWGEEYSTQISDEQREQADFLADMGADVIIGSHPHVVQDVFEIKTDDRVTTVYYSLGNFLALQEDEATRTGALAELYIIRDRNMKVHIIPNIKDIKTIRKGSYYSVEMDY